MDSETKKMLWWLSWVLIALIIIVVTVRTSDASPRDGRRTTATYYTGSFGACGKSLTGNYAASKFYKCGQKVLVKHNGKQVTVTILDRCQCMMDMAKHAFAKLAPTSKGVIAVRLYKK